MFGPMEVEGDSYLIKPMNCPFHMKIYKTQTRSYRNLPLRWAELGTVYRFERSGVLHGLTRVRGFTQDDAHIICTPDQLSKEIENLLKFSFKIFKTFGFKDYDIYFNLTERFDIAYINEKGKKQKPFMIHRAILGSLERFIGVLLEHYAGSMPLWLSPEQIWVIPLGTKHEKYAKIITETLRAAGFRTQLKNENETVSKKIRGGEMQKIPYLLVVGDKEMKAKSVRVRERKKGDIGEIKVNKFIEKIKKY